METFGRAAARIAVAGALILSLIGIVHAAGALRDRAVRRLWHGL